MFMINVDVTTPQMLNGKHTMAYGGIDAPVNGVDTMG